MTAQQHNQTDRNELHPLNMILREGMGGNDLMRDTYADTRACTHPGAHIH